MIAGSKYTFTKKERLSDIKLLDELFRLGSSFILHPFRIVWLLKKDLNLVSSQLIISIPKRKFKRAVDRNLIRRRIREAYRLHKFDFLYSFLDQERVLLGIVYIGKEIPKYHYIETKILQAFLKLKKYHLDL